MDRLVLRYLSGSPARRHWHCGNRHSRDGHPQRVASRSVPDEVVVPKAAAEEVEALVADEDVVCRIADEGDVAGTVAVSEVLVPARVRTIWPKAAWATLMVRSLTRMSVVSGLL